MYMYVYIDRGRITGKEMRSEPYSKLISGKGVFAQLETSKKLQLKKQHESKVNYWKIFLVEYVSTYLGKEVKEFGKK